jgi:hypothetical protein
LRKLERVYFIGQVHPKKRKIFKKILVMFVPITKSFVLDCSTKWNSTYLMFRML